MNEMESQSEKRELSMLEIEKARKDRREKIDSLLSNTDYFKWLVEFTQRYSILSYYTYYTENTFSRIVTPNNAFAFNNGWLSHLCDEDRKNVEMLGLFYNGIQEYADLHHIGTNVSLKLAFEFYHLVKLNDVCLKIIHISKYNKYSCQRITNFEDKDTIDLAMIIDSKTKEKLSKVKRFQQIMDDYYAKQTESLTLQEIFEHAGEKDFFNNLSIEEIQALIDDTDEHSKLRYIFENIKKQKELERETQENIKTLKLKK